VSENEAILRSFGAEHGVLVESVEPGGPAEKAGLRRGDVITEVAGTPIHRGDDLVNKVAALPVGQPAGLRYIRDKKDYEATVIIEDRYKVFADQFGEEPAAEESPEASTSLGMTLEELTPAQASQYGLERDENGLIVTDVEPGSFADRAGVLPRDVILEFNQQPVRSRRAFAAILSGLKPGDPAVFYVKRRMGNRWVALYLGESLPR
jgi:serine protease Do